MNFQTSIHCALHGEEQSGGAIAMAAFQKLPSVQRG